jgi:hypothetical protein
LALVVALGAYLRQVDVAAMEIYEKIDSEELKHSWPLNATYTTERLINIERMHNNLKRVTSILFVFIIISSLRLTAYAIYVTPTEYSARISDMALYYWDTFMMLFLVLAFSVMFWMHLKTSCIESKCVKAMREMRKTAQNLKSVTTPTKS